MNPSEYQSSPNNRFLALFPKISGDEYHFLIPFLSRLDEQQTKDFLRMYNDARFDRQTYILLAALGFMFTSGFQRFYIGDWGMGLIYMLTCGLFGIGSIYDIATAKDKVLAANLEKARTIYSNFGNPYEVL